MVVTPIGTIKFSDVLPAAYRNKVKPSLVYKCPSMSLYVELFWLTVILSQFSNVKAPRPILVRPLPMTTLLTILQPLNARSPIVVTLSGISILVRRSQLKNAEEPIVVTLSGIITPVRLSLR